MRYSGFRVIKEALTGHRGWGPAWRDADPKPAYDYVIIGGGGHGLATAYYLAKELQAVAHRRAGKGLDRGRQCGAEHHDCAVELHARWE